MALFDWEIHYEVQVLDGGRWAIVAVSRDAAEARGIARRLFGRPQFAGVRVVREIRDRNEDRAATAVLFERLRPVAPRRFFLPARAVVRAPRPAAAGAPGAPCAPPLTVSPATGGGLPLTAILTGAAVGLALLLLALAG